VYKLSKFNVDGVVESPIYCVAAVFRNSAYYMYCLVSEKPLRLVYGTFYLAIGDTFYKTVNVAFTTLIYSGNWLNN